jgi:hypothetical protein
VLALFIPAVLLASINIAILLVRLQSNPHHRTIDRRRFLRKLRKLYEQRQYLALRGEQPLLLNMHTISGNTINGPRFPQSEEQETSVLGLSTSTAAPSSLQVYEAAEGRLLLLGEAGAGKTTSLIDLACRLLDHARDDESCPLRILFNLATWAINRRPITDWLIEELVDTYEVSKTYHAPLQQNG